MATPATLADLLDRLQRGEQLLLPSARAARELRAAFDARQRELGVAAWQPPRAVSWQQWTTGLFNDLVAAGHETRLLLNPAQERRLWREVLDADPPPAALTSADALAELCASALQRSAAWSVPAARLRGAATTDDTRTFARWAAEFTTRCNRQRLLSPSLLDAALGQHLSAATLTAPATLHLVGFTHLTPAQQSLLDALTVRGTELTHLALAPVPSLDHATLIAANPREELQLAARWLRTTLEATPTAHIAVLVPTLDDDRAAIESVLRDTLTPELQSIAADLSCTPWEFAAGAPLHTLPLIATALDIARWALNPLPQARITALLLSPSLTTTTAREDAALLDAHLRRRETRLRSELTLQAFVDLLDKHRSSLMWPRNLLRELNSAKDLTKPRTFADWMELLRKLIRATGWPTPANDPGAPSIEAARAFDAVLDLVSTLDFTGKPVALSEALAALEIQLQSTPFTPPSTRAQIQIMHPADAEACNFDAVLFLRATDANWPPAERPHPLLPWPLQTALRMPGTDPALTTARARDLTQTLLATAPTVLITAAAEDASGALRPSPIASALTTDLSSRPEAQRAVVERPAVQPITPIPLDLIPDTTPLPAPPEHVFGGTGVLSAQAACGFRAFAEYRLLSKEPDSSELGLGADRSGRIIHRVLNRLWDQVQTQQALRALSATEQEALLRSCIDDSIDHYLQPEPGWDTAFLAAQKEALLHLLRPWLAEELARGPFSIAGLEVDAEVAIGPLAFSVRYDRIDRVLDGNGEAAGFFLVDYKTGRSGTPAQWESERPEDPQMPLYATQYPPGELKGLAFAKLLPGKGLEWLGYQSAAGQLPPIRTRNIVDLDSCIAEWQSVLTQLAEDFHAGRAEVDPREYPETCRYCRQRALCRLDPAKLHNITLDEAADETFDAIEVVHG